MLRLIIIPVRMFAWLALCASLAACSAQQITMTVPFALADEPETGFVLQEAVTVKAKRSKPTMLRAGTRWTNIGAIEQGDVFSTSDQVVIVNSFDVHEASIVVSNAAVVGYFLKVEGTFVEVEQVSVILILE